MNEQESAKSTSTEILSAADVRRTIARIAHQIIEKTAVDDAIHHGEDTYSSVVLLGIPSGGVPLAQRLREKINEFTGIDLPTGSLDITLYRDDLREGPHRALQPTHIPVPSLEAALVILVDDVLYSGRTIRAALDALRDIGRPAAIQLACLIDRGHRELPIRADYVGKNLPTSRTEDVTVLFEAIDGRDAVYVSTPAAS